MKSFFCRKWQRVIGLSFLIVLIGFGIWSFCIKEKGGPVQISNTAGLKEEEEPENQTSVSRRAESYEKLAAVLRKEETLMLPDKSKISDVPALFYEYTVKGDKISAYLITSGSEALPQLIVNAMKEKKISFTATPSGTVTYKGVEIEEWGTGYTMCVKGGFYQIVSQDTEKALEVTKSIIDRAVPQ